MLALNFLKFKNHNYLAILFIIVSIHCDGDLYYNGRDGKDPSKLSRTEFYGRIDAAILLKAELCGSKENFPYLFSVNIFRRDLPQKCDSLTGQRKELENFRTCQSKYSWFEKRDVNLCISEIVIQDCQFIIDRRSFPDLAFPYCYSMLRPDNSEY